MKWFPLALALVAITVAACGDDVVGPQSCTERPDSTLADAGRGTTIKPHRTLPRPVGLQSNSGTRHRRRRYWFSPDFSISKKGNWRKRSVFFRMP